MITKINKDGIKFTLKGYVVPAHLIDTGQKIETDIEAKISTNDYGGKTFKILNGVTGYEQWELARILSADDITGDFLVCAGTKNRWDKMAIYEHEWATFSDYAKELLKNNPDMAQIEAQAKNLGTAMERLGVSAQDASKTLKHVINCIPEEIWDLLEAEIKRRGI